MNISFKSILTAAAASLCLGISVQAYADTPEVRLDEKGMTVSIRYANGKSLEGIYGSYRLEGKTIRTTDYSKFKTDRKPVNDGFGKGECLTLTWEDKELPTLEQLFYSYESQDYVLTEMILHADKGKIRTNWMAPLNVSKSITFPENGDNRVLSVPFDNDCFIRYKSREFGKNRTRSYEVTSIFNNLSRNGLVIGSVEHSDWKTAIDAISPSPDLVSSICCFGGVADKQTRDTHPHGFLEGKSVKSPMILIGFFEDWRDGMETFARANTILHPTREWSGSVPFGWNSWGTLKFNMNHQNATEVSDYFNEKLQKQSFCNGDGTLYIGLDSGWNKMSEEELKDFVENCRKNGQKAGIYWAPFADWSKKPEQPMKDAPEYRNKEVYLYSAGEPQLLDRSYAYDPTHPAHEIRMKKYSDLFHRCGFEYLKIDFLSHASMEADSWYRKEITTGIQAYNYAMNLIDKYFGDMYINLSIAPLFPYQYAQSRRIACDSWNKIKHTEYTMNALSYGWWLSDLYQYNDPDHIVLRDVEESENRARITSGAITGLYIIGDDFSATGDPEVKRRAEKYLTNPEVNAVADGRSFRPVEGNGEKSEHQFVRKETDGSIYYVSFNYSEEPVTEEVPFDRIGISHPEKYQCRDLWKREFLKEVKNGMTLPIPAKDVRFLKFIP